MRYSGRSGDRDGEEEATAPAIFWSGPDFGLLIPLPLFLSREASRHQATPKGVFPANCALQRGPDFPLALFGRRHTQAAVSSLICRGRKTHGRPVYPAKSPVVPRYAAKLLDKLGPE